MYGCKMFQVAAEKQLYGLFTLQTGVMAVGV